LSKYNPQAEILRDHRVTLGFFVWVTFWMALLSRVEPSTTISAWALLLLVDTPFVVINFGGMIGLTGLQPGKRFAVVTAVTAIATCAGFAINRLIA